MTSPTLKLLERKMLRRQTPEQAPAPEGGLGLGFAIERLIAEEVERRVAEAMDERAKQPPHVRDLFRAPAPVTDYRDLPPAPRAQPPKEPLNMIIHRDATGLILWCEMNDGRKVEVLRDATGQAIALREITESPVLPALDIPFKAEARTYQPRMRKLYGNTPEV